MGRRRVDIGIQDIIQFVSRQPQGMRSVTSVSVSDRLAERCMKEFDPNEICHIIFGPYEPSFCIGYSNNHGRVFPADLSELHDRLPFGIRRYILYLLQWSEDSKLPEVFRRSCMDRILDLLALAASSHSQFTAEWDRVSRTQEAVGSARGARGDSAALGAVDMDAGLRRTGT